MKRITILFTVLLIANSNMIFAQNNPATLPLGIDTRDVPIAGSKDSEAHRAGIQGSVREKPKNEDATRYLEKAVNDNNAERVAKLLQAGASAYISYDMIKNKQYDIIELMHKNNPKLIRYSQLIHYACMRVDTVMIDFLVERGASLDLCGCYFEKYKSDYFEWLCRIQCGWNSDRRFVYTPADVMLSRLDNSQLYLEKKYGKRPTAWGYAKILYRLIEKNIDKAEKLLAEGMYIGNGEIGKEGTAEILNCNVFQAQEYTTGEYRFEYKKCLVEAIELLAKKRSELRRSSGEKRLNLENEVKKYEAFISTMIEKGADVNCYEENMSTIIDTGLSYNPEFIKTPLLAAMQQSDMLDIVKMLISKGAQKKVKVAHAGKTYTVNIEQANIKDEYKELLIIGEL